MHSWLIEILQCPLTGERLCVADSADIARLQQLQRAKQLYSHKGIPLDQAFDSGLVNQSRTRFYLVSNEIASLLPDEAVAL